MLVEESYSVSISLWLFWAAFEDAGTAIGQSYAGRGILLGVHIAVALLGCPRTVGPLLVAVLAQELLILLHN
jgi:hypothetical protein